MSTRHLLIGAVVVVVGYMVWKHMQPSAVVMGGQQMANPAGGEAPRSAEANLFDDILKTATSIANAVGSVAQSSAKNQ